MPLDFPENPVLNQIYPYNSIRWKWNGYAWDSSGVCGSYSNIGGICGDYVERITDGIGITLSSSTGVVEVSLRLDEPNIGPQNTQVLHNAPTSFSAESGFARKVAFLQSDGSISFDYIKNYDVFRKAEFEFDILNYTISNITPQLISQINTYLNLNPYLATISYNQLPVEGTIKVINTTSAIDQVGFPVIISSVGLSIFDFTTSQQLRHRELTYTNVGNNQDYYNLQIGITGQDADGTIRFKTKDLNIYFYNYIFYGESQLTSITEANFSSLTASLNGSRAFTINTTITQDNATPYYLYYAYPSRLGIATFKDNSTNIEGGFFQQVGVFNYTNANNYTEPYVIWRSEQGNLGTISISVT